MFPWVSKSSFLAVALIAVTFFLLSASYLLFFTERTQLEVHADALNSDCTRLSDVSGSLTNAWPPTHLTFQSLNSQTPLLPQDAQSKWLAWWDDTQYRVHLDTTWAAELENDLDWKTCFSNCRLTHAVDHSGTEFYIKADSNADVRLDHANLGLKIYNFPGQSEFILSLTFEYVHGALLGTLTQQGSSSPVFFQPARFFSQTIVLNLKFYSNSFEVWVSQPSPEAADGNIGDSTQTRAFYLSNYPFSGPYWIVVEDINGGSENEAFWTVEGTAQPPATQDYFWTGSSALSLSSVYFESESACKLQAPAICEALTDQMEISLTTGSYDEPTCYSSDGTATHSMDGSVGMVEYSWEDMVWQGRDLNTGLGWNEIISDLRPRAHEQSYSNLASEFPPDNWYVCGYKSVPLWTDCLQDIRCVYEDSSGAVRRMMFSYQVSSAIVEFGEIPCIEKITATQLFVRRILDDDASNYNCIAPASLTTMDYFLEVPGAMNSWWNCDAFSSVEECLSEPHRGLDQCVVPLFTFPSTLEECELSDFDCSVVTKFDGIIPISQYAQKYAVDLSVNITGQSIFNFTHLYISPHDQCQLISDQLCDDEFTSALCSRFAGSGPYLCDTDLGQDYLAVAMDAAGIAALCGWMVLFTILLFQTGCFCCGRKDVLLEKRKALEKRKRDKRRKKREKKRLQADQDAKKEPPYSGMQAIKVEVAQPVLQVNTTGSYDIRSEGRFQDPDRPPVNDPLQIQELEDLANGTLPLLYSEYSQQSYQNTHSPRTRQPYSNNEMYNQFSSPQLGHDLAYEEFGDNHIPNYHQHYSWDPESLPSEYQTPNDGYHPVGVMGDGIKDFGSIPVSWVRGSPLESRFLSDRSSTLTTTGSNPELASLSELDQDLEDHTRLSPCLEGDFGKFTTGIHTDVEEMFPKVEIRVTEHVDQSSPSSLSEFRDPSVHESSKVRASTNPSSSHRPSWTEGDNFADKLEPIPFKSNLNDAIDNYDRSSEDIVKRYSHSGSSAQAAAKSPRKSAEEPIAKLRRLFSKSSSKSAEPVVPKIPTASKNFDPYDSTPHEPMKGASVQGSADFPRNDRRRVPVPSSHQIENAPSKRLPQNEITKPHIRNPTPMNRLTFQPPQANQVGDYTFDIWTGNFVRAPKYEPSRHVNAAEVGAAARPPPLIPRRPSIPSRRSEQTDQGMTSSFKTSSYMRSSPQDRDELSSLPDSEDNIRKQTDSIPLNKEIRKTSHQVVYDPDPLPYNYFQKFNQEPTVLKKIDEKPLASTQPAPDSWWSRFENLRE